MTYKPDDIIGTWRASLTPRQRIWLLHDPTVAIVARAILRSHRRGLRGWHDMLLRFERVRKVATKA